MVDCYILPKFQAGDQWTATYHPADFQNLLNEYLFMQG